MKTDKEILQALWDSERLTDEQADSVQAAIKAIEYRENDRKPERITYEKAMKPVFEKAFELTNQQTRLSNSSIEMYEEGGLVVLEISPTRASYLATLFWNYGKLCTKIDQE